LCNKKDDVVKNPGSFSKEELVNLIAQDISLCKTRANLKNQIDQAINSSIINGGISSVEEVKNYGQ
jgi:hypothetical protein